MPDERSDPVGPDEWLCSECHSPRGMHSCLSGFRRRLVDYIGMLRVRNEARWLPEVLESILPLCSEVWVMDDHSTDNTRDICGRYYPQVRCMASPFTGLDEARDKNWLYDRILVSCEPRWILCIDGDEVLEKMGPATIRHHCDLADIAPLCEPSLDCFRLKIEYLWGDRDRVRTDRVYGDFWRPSLFCPFVPRIGVPDDMKLAADFRWKSTPFGRLRNGQTPNLHCSSVPQRRLAGARAIPVRLKHLGYMMREDRVKKFDYYTRIDWGNHAEDCYRHMIQGDSVQLSELPAVRELIREGCISAQEAADVLDSTAPESKLLHAGPLVIRKWDEGAPWGMSQWARDLR